METSPDEQIHFVWSFFEIISAFPKLPWCIIMFHHLWSPKSCGFMLMFHHFPIMFRASFWCPFRRCIPALQLSACYPCYPRCPLNTDPWCASPSIPTRERSVRFPKAANAPISHREWWWMVNHGESWWRVKWPFGGTIFPYFWPIFVRDLFL